MLGLFAGIVIGSTLMYGGGYGKGFADGVKYAISTGYNFLEAQGIDFSLTAEKIGELIGAYKTEFERTSGSQHTKGELIINDG